VFIGAPLENEQSRGRLQGNCASSGNPWMTGEVECRSARL